MRVGLVLDHYDPQRGGVEQWTSQYIDRLVAYGDEVHVVASGFAADLQQSVVTHHVPGHRSRLQWGAALESRLRELDLDIVHDMGVGWYCDILQPHGGCRAAWFEQTQKMLPAWKRPLRRLAAGCLPRYREYAELSRRQALGRHLLVALSHMTKADLSLHDGVPTDRLRLVYNGVDVRRFSPANRDQYRTDTRSQLRLSPQTTVFLIVAHNLRLKGLPTLLESLARTVAVEPDVHLLVAGSRRTACFQRQAERLGVGQHVTFLGPVTDPVPYYSAADAYVQPSCYDCCSLVVLEALASGLPVITTAFNGAGELLSEGRDGFVIDDPFDARALSAAMQRLLDPVPASRMGIRARSLAEQHSFDRNAREIRALYDEVAGHREIRSRAA